MKRSTKGWLIAATVLLLGGGLLFAGVLAAHHGDFTALDTVDCTTETVDITGAFRNISVKVDTADVVIVPSEDGTCRAVLRAPEGMRYTAAAQGGTLMVEETDTRTWIDRLTRFSFESPRVTLYVPDAAYGSLIVKDSTGDIRVERVSAEIVELSVSTGAVDVTSVVCTGDMSVAAGTGDIRLTRCDAARLSLQTSTGSITGSLLTGKRFNAKTDTGRVSVPASQNSGGVCVAATHTGDIVIDVL